MADKTAFIKPVAAVAGVAFVSSLAVSTTAAADNPFELTDLDAGYMLAGGDKGEEGKCGEGKCGSDGEKGEEGKCGEEKGEEGKCGSDGEKGEEGKCGEGKCGA